MSELFWSLGGLDERVRPLMFFVRRWANEWRVTRTIRPGPWMTNFTLSCLVLFFLQQLKQPILPTMDQLKQQAHPLGDKILIDNIDSTFLRDFNRLEFTTHNTDPLDELIEQFFTFCTEFSFSRNGISLNTGSVCTKDGRAAMHIVNPMEPDLNVSVNISHHEVIDFQRKTEDAHRYFRQIKKNGLFNLSKFFDRQSAIKMMDNVLETNAVPKLSKTPQQPSVANTMDSSHRRKPRPSIKSLTKFREKD